jgi:predicted transposase/invertase (TIGR01784 family)
MKKLIRLDWAIKNILRDKANFGILEGFLSELFGYEVKIQEILESEGNQDSAYDKYNRVDILVKDNHNQLVIVEIQNYTQMDYLQKILFSSSKLVTQYMKLGESYAKIKKAITVSILYFDIGEGSDYIYHGSTKFVGIHNNDILDLSEKQKILFDRASISSLFPEHYLIRIPVYNDKISDTLDEWMFFLKNEDIRDDFSAKGLPEAKHKLHILKLSESEQQIYRRYLENLSNEASITESTYGIGKLDGMIEGREEGREERNNEIVLSLHKENQSVDFISRVTGLSKDQVREIIEKKSI